MLRTVVLTANSSWNIVNFRSGLINALKDAGYRPVVVAPEDRLVELRMAELGVERFGLTMDRSGLNPVSDFRLFRAYRRLLKQIRPIAVFSFTIKPNIYGSLAASSLRIAAFPNVSGLGTAFIRGGPLRWLVSQLYRIAFRKVPLVFFQNPDDRALFNEIGIVDARSSKVLPGSGVDLDRFARVAPTADPSIFLLIGRLLGDKGVREYVLAARQLRYSLPGARFQLLGPIDGGNRSGVSNEEVARWVGEGVVEYLGTTDDVRPYIASASAIVLPSYREGLPRSLLEGAAMARPLIATDVPGCRELIEDGVNGFLCAVQDPASLAGAMARFAGLSQADRENMGAASRMMVQERFSEAVVISTYLEALARLESAPG